MIQELVEKIDNFNVQDSNLRKRQVIKVLKYNIEEGTLYLDFNNKLTLKLTHNSDKGFLKFEVLMQDEKFWSKDSSEVFSYEAKNGINVISDFYLDFDKAFSYIGLLGSQSLINDGVVIYLPKYIPQSETYYINQVFKLIEALFEWSYNAPEFQIKNEVKLEKVLLSKETEKSSNYFNIFVNNKEFNDNFEITGFNFVENFDDENSLIMIKIKKEVE